MATDAARTTTPPGLVPCPDCGGAGRTASTVPGVPAAVCTKSVPCDRCWPRDADGERLAWDDGTAGSLPFIDTLSAPAAAFVRWFNRRFPIGGM